MGMKDSLTNSPTEREIKMTKQEFVDVYTNRLEEAVRAYPQEYGWPISQAPVVAYKMLKALENGSYNKDSRALKKICKEQNVTFTYAGINAFVRTLA
jgi:hypothetical protein